MKNSEQNECHNGDVMRFKLMNLYLKSGNILDVGFANKPNPFIHNVTGVDIGVANKPLNYDHVVACDVSKELPFDNGEFNNILAGEIIEHLENPSYFVRECHRVLKKDGVLIMTTPNVYDPIRIIRNYCEVYKPSDHVSELSFNMIKTILQNNGFTFIKMRGVYMVVPILARLFKFCRHVPVKSVIFTKIILFVAKRNDVLNPEQIQREALK